VDRDTTDARAVKLAEMRAVASDQGIAAKANGRDEHRPILFGQQRSRFARKLTRAKRRYVHLMLQRLERVQTFRTLRLQVAMRLRNHVSIRTKNVSVGA